MAEHDMKDEIRKVCLAQPYCSSDGTVWDSDSVNSSVVQFTFLHLENTFMCLCVWNIIFFGHKLSFYVLDQFEVSFQTLWTSLVLHDLLAAERLNIWQYDKYELNLNAFNLYCGSFQKKLLNTLLHIAYIHTYMHKSQRGLIVGQYIIESREDVLLSHFTKKVPVHYKSLLSSSFLRFYKRNMLPTY